MQPVLSYAPLPIIHIGPLRLFTWGICVAAGIAVATAVAVYRGKKRGTPGHVLLDLAVLVAAAGFIGSRLFFVLEYWRTYISEPFHIFFVWEGGMSITGGIVLGLAAGLLFLRKKQLPLRSILPTIAPTLLLGDAIGRLGGAASHMYPGIPTHFPLSFVLDGVQRHEVGVELSLASLAGFFVLLGVERWGREELLTPLVLLLYSAERFLLDFLRAYDLPNADIRYAHLTLAQYGALSGIAVAVFILLPKMNR